MSTELKGGVKNTSTQVSPGTVAKLRYDAFGNIVGASGTWAGNEAHGGGFGYQTDSTGLQLLGHRWYDPLTGRFISKDPIGSGDNWYAYCDNNPLTAADPMGLAQVILFWYEVAGVGSHTGILIFDNDFHKGGDPVWSFAGGPSKYPQWRCGEYDFDSGLLRSRSGPWKQGTMDYNLSRKLGGWKSKNKILLISDSKAANRWVRRFEAIEMTMSKTSVPYNPTPSGNSGNSNSWARELLERAGLLKPYDRAINKKGGAPWVPGWHQDLWP